MQSVALSLKIGTPAVILGADCKVNPDDVRLLFYQQFIEILIIQV